MNGVAPRRPLHAAFIQVAIPLTLVFRLEDPILNQFVKSELQRVLDDSDDRMAPTLVVHPTTEVATSEAPAPVAGALDAADAWIELNTSYLMYGNTWKKAMKAGVRYFIFGGDVDSYVRMVGRVDYAVLDTLAKKLVELSNRASEMHVTSAEGTDLKIQIDAKRSSPSGHVTMAGVRYMGEFTGKSSSQVPPGQVSFGQ